MYDIGRAITAFCAVVFIAGVLLTLAMVFGIPWLWHHVAPWLHHITTGVGS